MSENTPVFDPRRKHSTVEGDSCAAFFQDGHYFKPSGEYVPPDVAAQPTANGSFSNAVENAVEERMAEANADKPLTLVDEGNVHTNKIPHAGDTVAEKRAREAAERQAADDAANAEEPDEIAKSRVMLEGLHISEVRRLTEQNNLEVIKGRGSKKKMIDALLATME